ncbi:MAG TPA: hypothetical protein DEA08_38425 [Planctomycetes bacterium]|nr:hypothetical protein [Planctomycetota bacterium]
MVLRDDAFETIVEAIRSGRTIFSNIRQAILYLLSGNLAEILAVGAATAVAAPLPLLPLQILFINFLFDVFPALALAVSSAREGVLEHPPRDPRESIVTARHWAVVGAYGALIATSVTSAFAYAHLVLRLSDPAALTVSFFAFCFARLLHVLNMRSPKSNLLINEVTTNGYAWASMAACALLLTLAATFPPLTRLLHLSDPGAAGWSVALIGGALPFVVSQLYLGLVGGRRGGD